MLRHILFLMPVAAMFVACGETPPESQFQPTAGATTTGGGKTFTPPPSGEYVNEMEACQKLLAAFTTQKSKVCGQSTVPICPQFLRSQYSPDCMFYDAGAVQGCINHYKGLTLCADLVAADCVVTAYPDTAPTGCTM